MPSWDRRDCFWIRLGFIKHTGNSRVPFSRWTSPSHRRPGSRLVAQQINLPSSSVLISPAFSTQRLQIWHGLSRHHQSFFLAQVSPNTRSRKTGTPFADLTAILARTASSSTHLHLQSMQCPNTDCRRRNPFCLVPPQTSLPRMPISRHKSMLWLLSSVDG